MDIHPAIKEAIKKNCRRWMHWMQNTTMQFWKEETNGDALEYFENALDICETIYTTAHPDTALAYHNIGATLSESGNDEEGMEYLEKSVAMNKLIYGENHPRLAENYMDMGSIMVDRENYQQALSYFDKTFDISNTMLGPDHADTVQAKQLIALCRKRLNDR